MQRKIYKIFLFLLVFMGMFTISQTHIFAKPSEKYVIPGGETIGLQLDTGVYVAGKYQVKTKSGKVSPWKNADIEDGDKLIYVENEKVSTNEDVLNVLRETNKEELTVVLQRNNRQIKTKIDVVITDNRAKSIGLYIKDRLLGIGTLTFIDPETKAFASLGHGIYDANTIIGSMNGVVTTSKIESIKKASPGKAGEKRASISNTSIGKITKNQLSGVYGKISSPSLLSKDLIMVGCQDDVHNGKASIKTVINQNVIESFDIEIVNVNLQSDTNIKGIKFKVTDDVLIAKTGGIIQGMSGSPIIQDGKLIGAVSHVTIDDPLIGYGMHIEWMLNDAK